MARSIKELMSTVAFVAPVAPVSRLEIKAPEEGETIETLSSACKNCVNFTACKFAQSKDGGTLRRCPASVFYTPGDSTLEGTLTFREAVEKFDKLSADFGTIRRALLSALELPENLEGVRIYAYDRANNRWISGEVSLYFNTLGASPLTVEFRVDKVFDIQAFTLEKARVKNPDLLNFTRNLTRKEQFASWETLDKIYTETTFRRELENL